MPCRSKNRRATTTGGGWSRPTSALDALEQRLTAGAFSSSAGSAACATSPSAKGKPMLQLPVLERYQRKPTASTADQRLALGSPSAEGNVGKLGAAGGGV